jgi:fumarylacetoacetate (FAA) hydrolase
MRLATLDDGTPDGRLVLVSPDGARVTTAPVATLQAALDRWDEVAPALLAIDAGAGELLGERRFAAPLPRAWQWLDASAFPSHGALMQRAFGLPPIESDRPLMYQGMSHQFLGPLDDVPLPDEAEGIDFEGEYAVVTGAVPMGIVAADALAHVRLILVVNDWSLRAIAPVEMKTGFGWIGAKPACSVAPFAVTPDELGEAWRNGRVCLPLHVELNGDAFGHPDGAAMAYGFGELIAHAARTRSLPAGTIIGSGTVSNEDQAVVGSTCIAERRGAEMIAHGEPRTGFMRFGDRVRMAAHDRQGGTPFGTIDQCVVRG